MKRIWKTIKHRFRFFWNLFIMLIRGVSVKTTRSFYDKFALRYDDVFGDDELAAEEMIKNHLHGGSKILDIACGTGATTFSLFKKYPQVFGVDISRGMLDEARKKNRSLFPERSRRASFTQGSFASLPYKDNTFDAAICVGAIWHLKEDEEKHFVDEVYRVLKPGGIFITTAQALDSERKSLGRLISQWFGNRKFVRDKVQLGKFTVEYISDMFGDEKFITKIANLTLEKENGSKADWPIVEIIKYSGGV